MTVSTQVSRNEYTGNGATTQYDFTFRILDKSHLLVQTLDTSESIVTLTLGTDYTVTGVNRYNGGKVVLTSALPAGYKISIERSTPVTQEASIRNQGGFFPEIHEDAFDKLTMLVQQAYGWWSGLSLRKPSWLANYYDALNNRIRNLRDPSLAQDAATKNYVDSADSGLQQQITSNFNRSLRVPDSYINQLPSAGERAWKGLGFDGAGQPKLQDPAGTGLWGYVPVIGSFEKGSLLTQRFEVLLWESTDEYWRWDGAMPKIVLPDSTPATAGGTGKGKWIDVTDATLRANLGSSEGSKLAGYRYSDVYSALSRIKTLYDYGVVTEYGHNLVADAQIRRDAEDDNDLLIPGNVSIAKENRGVGRDGTALSVRMGTGDESGLGFFPQVTGVSSTVQLANYGDGTPDGVAAYIDITGNAYANWEDVSESDVVYTETGCILTSSTAKIKRGNVIKTKHDTPFVGIVNSVDGSVITLKDGWVAVGATETSTPTAGFGCYINPQNKVWAINSNLTLSENGRSTIGVIQELGILNRKGYNSEIGGIDLVHLAQSTFDSGYGLRIRPANGSNTRSISGVLVQGSQYSFYSSGGGGFSPTYGLFVAGQHEAGAMFSGIGGSKKAIQIQNGAGVARTAINGDGYVEKLHKNVLVASAATLTVPDSYPDVISVVETAQVITLANSGVVPRMVTIEKFGSAGTLAVQPASGNILYKGSYVANVSITGAGKIELRLINITSNGLYQWAANIYKGD